MLFEKIELEPGEALLKVVRKHWFVILTELAGIAIMLLFPFIILSLFVAIPDEWNIFNLHPEDYKALITYAVCGWFILCIMSGFAIWTHYFLDLWIITDRRIIVVDQVRFFNRNVSIFRLERLQDIEFYIKGIIPTFLNFGTVKAQTASAFESNFKSTGLPDPRGLQATIQKAMDARLAYLNNHPSTNNSVD